MIFITTSHLDLFLITIVQDIKFFAFEYLNYVTIIYISPLDVKNKQLFENLLLTIYDKFLLLLL
jgi:hypothetical protein